MTPRREISLRAAAGLAAAVGLVCLAIASPQAQAVARSFWLIDSAQNAIASAIATPATGDRGLVVRRAGSYGTKTTITWTGTSLANGSARESTAIDNSATGFADVHIRVQTKGQTSGTSYVDVYVYEALGDSTYTDGATGSDAAFTAANRLNSRYLGSIKMNAGTTAVQAAFKLSDIFGTVPAKWGLILINNSGAALSATAGDHVVEYQGVS